MFHPAPAPSQEEIEWLVERVSTRVLRFLQRRGVLTLVTAPGDGEVTVVTDETLGEKGARRPGSQASLGPARPATSPRARRARPSPSASCSTPTSAPSPRALCAG